MRRLTRRSSLAAPVAERGKIVGEEPEGQLRELHSDAPSWALDLTKQLSRGSTEAREILERSPTTLEREGHGSTRDRPNRDSLGTTTMETRFCAVAVDQVLGARRATPT